MWRKLVKSLVILFLYIIHLSLVKGKLPLLFPPTAPTRTQWIIGIGIPLQDLTFEDLTTGYVLKAEYFLPETVEQLKHHSMLPIAGRHLNGNLTKFQRFSENHKSLTLINEMLKKYKHRLSGYRWSVYKILEVMGNRMTLNGRLCLLKSICELSALPFHYSNGLFAELLHIIFRPSSSSDEFSSPDDQEYIEAERLGARGADCHQEFKMCPKSLLQYFSYIHQIGEDILNSLG